MRRGVSKLLYMLMMSLISFFSFALGKYSMSSLQPSPNQFKGWADKGVSSPVAYEVIDSIDEVISQQRMGKNFGLLH